jgi:hypothetical protein
MAWNTMTKFFFSATLLAGCTGRTGDAGTATMADDGDGGDATTDTADTDDGEGQTSGGATDGSDATGSDGGDAAPACAEPQRWCLPFQDGGTCVHGPDVEALCDGGEWVCPEGFAFEEDIDCTPECEGAGCWIPCQDGDTPPDECWDQGPGECADSTVPPWCADDGMWTCPNGFDFGGFGEGCTFPGD